MSVARWVTVVIWCPFRYYVGVLNKKTMQMEVHSAQIFNLHPVIPGTKRRISASVSAWLKRKQVLRFSLLVFVLQTRQ